MSYKKEVMRYFGFTETQFEEYHALVEGKTPIPAELNERLVQQGKQIGSSYDVITAEIARWVKQHVK